MAANVLAQIGTTEVYVTRLGLGAGVIGGLFAEVSEDAAIATVRRHRGASAHRRGSRALGLRF